VAEQVTLELQIGAPGERIWADPIEVEQILMNLAANARDAMPSGGTLTIRTDSIALDAEHAAKHDVDPGSRWVRLAVTDTGVGMDEPTLARIFEPFFTTKDVGKGTGLGLSTVFAVTRQLGAHVDVRSEPGRGTTFVFCFPRCETEAVAEPEPRRVLPRFRGTVLVVEDAPLVRLTVRRDLEALGLEVLEADGIDEARRLCEVHRHAIDLLVSDVLLPTMPGPQLAELLRAHCPSLRLLFMTATPERAPAGAAVLRKPFDDRELAEALERVLGPEFMIGHLADPTSPPAPMPVPIPVRGVERLGEGTLLVVEDNELARMTIADVLESTGLRVLGAETVREALEVAAGSDPIDLVLADVNLPDGSGVRLVEKLRKTHPTLRAVFMSGAVDVPTGNDPLLTKPIALDALLQVVRDSLESDPS
jgi:CheY-like chemotaxis protein